MTTPTHYQPTGTGPTPWDLEKTMQSSGSCFVDSRRTDAIEYAYRLKGGPAGLLEDLRKARHCLDEAIAHLEARLFLPKIQPASFEDGRLRWWLCRKCVESTMNKKEPTGMAMEAGLCSKCHKTKPVTEFVLRDLSTSSPLQSAQSAGI
jgi:hypothetical protein